jgi:hypothetical protein
MIPEGIPATRGPVSQYEADRLLKDALASANPERTAELREWTSGARSKSCR